MKCVLGMIFGAVLLIGLFGPIVVPQMSSTTLTAQPAASENGDCNGDQQVNIADAIYLLDFLFGSGDPPVACGQDGELLQRLQSLEDKCDDLEEEIHRTHLTHEEWEMPRSGNRLTINAISLPGRYILDWGGGECNNFPGFVSTQFSLEGFDRLVIYHEVSPLMPAQLPWTANKVWVVYTKLWRE